MKKLLKTKIFILAFLAVFFVGCNSEQSNSSSSSSSLSEPTEIIEITSEDDLFAMANDLNGYYKLTNDITLTKNWNAIGSLTTPFTGELNGNGYTISSVTVKSDLISVDDDSISYTVGMFGVLKGKIYDLTVDGLNIEITANSITETSYSTLLSQNPSVVNLDVHAGLIGVNKGNVKNVTVNANINVIPEISIARIRTGIIAGKNNDSIKNCKVSGNINAKNISGYIRAGGIAGYVSSNGKIVSDQANVAITAEITSGAKMQLGGLIGNIECGIINDCFASGSIIAKNTLSKATLAGGLIGQIDNTETKYEDMSVTVSDCYSTVDLTVTGSKGYASGFIGQIDFNGAVTVSTNACSGTAVGEKASFGFVGRIQTALGSTLTISDFTNGSYGVVTFTSNTSVNYDDFTITVPSITIPDKFL